MRREYGTDPRAHGAGTGAIGSRDLQCDPTFGSDIVTGRVTASVKIHSDRGSALLKRFAEAVGGQDHQRNGAFDATAAAEIGVGRSARR